MSSPNDSTTTGTGAHDVARVASPAVAQGTAPTPVAPSESELRAAPATHDALIERFRAWQRLLGLEPSAESTTADGIPLTEAELEAFATALQAADEARAQLPLMKQHTTISRAFIEAALANGVRHVADACELADLDAIDVGDDGTVDAGSVDAAIETLRERRPYLFGAPKLTPLGVEKGVGHAPLDAEQSLRDQASRSGATDDVQRYWNERRATPA